MKFNLYAYQIASIGLKLIKQLYIVPPTQTHNLLNLLRISRWDYLTQAA